jgi:hypothetical protein
VETNLRRRKISTAPVVGVSEALRETAAAWLDIETSTYEALRKDAAATLLHAETKNEMGIVKKCHEELQVFCAQKYGIITDCCARCLLNYMGARCAYGALLFFPVFLRDFDSTST